MGTRSTSLIGGAARIGLGSIGAQITALVAAPILTRLYSPSEFGVGASFAAIYSWMVVVASLRFEKSILIARSPGARARLTRLSLLATLPVSIAVLVFVGVARWFGAHPVYLLLPLAVLSGGASQVVVHWLISTRQLAEVGRIRIRQAVASNAVQIGLSPLGAYGIPLGQMAGMALGTLPSFRRWKGRQHVRSMGLATALRDGVRMRSFPLITAPSAIINNAGLYLPVVLIGFFFGPAAAGFFALSQRLVNVPMQIVGNSIAQSYAGAFGAESLTGRRMLFTQATWSLMGAAALLVLVAGLTARLDLIGLVFGARFDPAGGLLLPLAIAAAFQLVASPLSQTILLRRRFGIQFGWDLGRALAIVAVIVASHSLGFSLVATCWSLACAGSLSYAILYGLSFSQLDSAPGPARGSDAVGA